jgi:putative peptidoglycan lipid II flippase
MVALGWPVIDLVFTGGRFSTADARECSLYFAIFSVSLFLWSAQAIYARAFYAAGVTFAPMVASTIVTVVSLPIYEAFFHWRGATGLAFASNTGIALQALTFALLLHQRRMVSLASLDYAEMGRCLLAALTSGTGAGLLAWGFNHLYGHLPALAAHRYARSLTDTVILIAGVAVWTLIAKWTLEKSGSALPGVVMRRLGLA